MRSREQVFATLDGCHLDRLPRDIWFWPFAQRHRGADWALVASIPPPAQAAREPEPHGASAEGGWAQLSVSVLWSGSPRPAQAARVGAASHGASAEGGWAQLSVSAVRALRAARSSSAGR